MEGEASAVIKKEERAGLRSLLMDRTHSKLISDAVACTHEFRSLDMSQFISLVGIVRAGRLIDLL